jgi:HWE histidine kinase
MVIESMMFKIDRRQDKRPSHSGAPPHEFLEAENVGLRLLLAQAEINAQGLLAQAGIDAREREASDKLQKLILEELHHRIKNTLATVSAIASQSLRDVQGAEHAQHAIAGGLTISFCRQDGPAPILAISSAAPPRPSTIRTCRNSRLRDRISG